MAMEFLFIDKMTKLADLKIMIKAILSFKTE